MNQLTILSNTVVTMSSLEIAELVQSRHYDVKRSIERLAEKGVIRLPPMAFSENINNLGFAVKSEMYVFTGEQGKLDSITVVAQLCPQFTAALVKRWYELENQQPKLPQTLPEALRLAADLAEQNQIQAQQLAIAEPKAAALDRVSAADGDMTITNAAKVLKMRPSDLFAYLSQLKWIYKRNGVGGWIGYQDKVQSGHLTHGEYRYESKSTGTEKLVAQVYVTPKGLAKLAQKLEVLLD